METEHTIPHARFQEFVSDVVIGMADGLTVPFALAAGLAGALPTTALIVTAGLAEIAAGCIAMGLGGYLAVRSEHDYYEAQHAKKTREMREFPLQVHDELASTLDSWGIHSEAVQSSIVESLTRDPEQCVEFMMKYHLGIEKPRPERARNSSVTIGASYIIGGIIPLSPYIFISNPSIALYTSVIVTIVALFLFGFGKGKSIGIRPFKSGIQTALVGGAAAAVAYAAARWIA